VAVEPFVEQFDHFVMPVDDLVAAEDFYTTVLGAPIARNRFGPMRLGLNVAQRKISLRPITFIKIGGKRIGLSLQDEMRPHSDDVRGAPTFSFETTSVGLKAVAAALEERGDAYELGKHHHEAIPYESLFCKDPAGNFLHLFVPDVPRREPGVAADSIVGHATAVSHLQLEAPDLDSAVRFYVDTLGLPLRGNGVNSRLDVREATLALPSGQLLILTELPFSPKA
jgi:catechol 2,3-dioxygenase-like lactoylglutathione lyase family enzyme